MLILHLSDLHFGVKGRFAEAAEKEGKKLAFQIKKLCKAYPRRFPLKLLSEKNMLVVVTGDIAETADKSEYEDALAFFCALADGLSLFHSRFLFAPGNHDVSWSHCKLAECETTCQAEFERIGGVEREKRVREAIDRCKFETFDEFLDDFWGENPPLKLTKLPASGRLYDLDDLGLSVAVFNSCERESHHKEHHVGFLGEEQIEKIKNLWQVPERLGKLKLVALHHPPKGARWSDSEWEQWGSEKRYTKERLKKIRADLQPIKGLEMLEGLVQHTRPQLVLHGHTHRAAKPDPWLWENGGEAIVLGVGSMGACESELPIDEDYHCRLIMVDRTNRKIRSQGLVYSATILLEIAAKPGGFKENVEDYRELDLSLPPSPPKKPLVPRRGTGGQSGSSPGGTESHSAHSSSELEGGYKPSENILNNTISRVNKLNPPSLLSLGTQGDSTPLGQPTGRVEENFNKQNLQTINTPAKDPTSMGKSPEEQTLRELLRHAISSLSPSDIEEIFRSLGNARGTLVRQVPGPQRKQDPEDTVTDSSVMTGI
ncbi:MAG: metallophosphoesterase [Magnetococcales bacterium]|nr:metallophosphoesterase [Magnetococcales bacterium]